MARPARVGDSILNTIGDTPLVRIRKMNPEPGVVIFAKLEGFNPMGSVKERIALRIVEEGERRGELRPGMTLLESSSGNTGIGLALVGAAKGYPVVVTMAQKVSVERRQILRALGAEDLAPLDRHLLRHGDHHRIALRGAHEREAYPGVPARGLEKGHAGPELAPSLPLLDDPQGDPLLDAPHGVEPLELGEDHHSRLRVHFP